MLLFGIFCTIWLFWAFDAILSQIRFFLIYILWIRELSISGRDLYNMLFLLTCVDSCSGHGLWDPGATYSGLGLCAPTPASLVLSIRTSAFPGSRYSGLGLLAPAQASSSSSMDSSSCFATMCSPRCLFIGPI